MKESPLKKTVNSPVWKHVLTILGVVAVIDWVIFPSLTAASTVFNVFGLSVAIGTSIFLFYYIKDTWFTKSDEEKDLEAKWKVDLEKKVEETKSKTKKK